MILGEMAIYYVSCVHFVFSVVLVGHNNRIWLENLKNCEGVIYIYIIYMFIYAVIHL